MKTSKTNKQRNHLKPNIMKTLQEKINEVREIKKNNRLVKDRISALESAGYEYNEMHPRYFNNELYHYEYFTCSRDWNRTFGFAIIKK
ncbi:MAG: hypothetical protein PF487_00990 [Bacteroidales bacterium]|jgi:hypothetical protein|nr:hypothetical protein [Bacteroidales bacterium]